MATKPTKHLTRRELKREDQIHATIARASSALMSRTMLLLVILILVVGSALGFLLWRNYQQSQDSKAQTEFGKALDAFHGLVTSPSTPNPNPSGIPVFANENEKYKKALDKFSQIYQQYRSRKVGRLARYYTALAQQQLKNNKEAIAILQEVEKGSDPEVRGLARNALAEIYRASGQNDQALLAYQAMLKDSESKFPKDALLASMGHVAEAMGRNSEAANYYQQLTREHAQSIYVGDARARLLVLNPPK